MRSSVAGNSQAFTVGTRVCQPASTAPVVHLTIAVGPQIGMCRVMSSALGRWSRARIAVALLHQNCSDVIQPALITASGMQGREKRVIATSSESLDMLTLM